MKKTGFVLILLISIISNSFIFSYDLGKLELKNKIKIKKRMYNSIKYYKKIYYLSNFRNAKIEMFDKNFNLLKKILSKGKGPGEIFSMMGKTNFIFDIKNRKIIVFDILAQRLHLYDIKGKFIETYNVNRAKKISRFKILDNNKI